MKKKTAQFAVSCDIDPQLIISVASGPSVKTHPEITATRDKIADLLGEDYEISLQGSYYNDTAISTLNDIDIIAVHKGRQLEWTDIFTEIVTKISTFAPYQLSVFKDVESIKLHTGEKNVNITPALRTKESYNPFHEPVITYNRNSEVQTKRYPQTHHAFIEQKDKATSGRYRQVIRMMKNFVKNHNLRNYASAYYLECLMYSYSDSFYSGCCLTSLYNIAQHICHNPDFTYNIPSVTGDKYVISASEWFITNFMYFKYYLAGKLPVLNATITAATSDEAEENFREFFNL